VDPSEIKYFGGPEKLLKELKNEIEKTLHVTYSLGLARTKALAKQASKLEKPAGVVMLLTAEDEEKALRNTPIDDIWGIGRQTIPRLKTRGIKTAYDFIHYSPKIIEKDFSAPLLVLQSELSGEEIMRVADDTDPRDQKSIQSTGTFHPASSDIKIIWREIAENAEHACKNARELSLVTNSVSFFIKTSEFKYYFEDIKLNFWTNDPGVILNAIEHKLPEMLKRSERIRSTGVILHNLTKKESVPLDLFGRQAEMLKISKVEEVADKLRLKHGKNVITRASSLKSKS
jgi:nucleotidyltransferase/DNA polymerase involved in DNA repair